jgi:hypothetical protein
MADIQEINSGNQLHRISFKPGRLFLFMILVFPVIVDLLNGFLTHFMGVDFSVGIMYRGLVFLISLPVFLFHKDALWKLYLFTMATFWIISCVIWAASGIFNPTKELVFFIKMIYPLVILPLVFYLVKSYKIEIDELIKYPVSYCTIAGASILFSLLTGLGIEFTASKFSFGAKSFFVAQNDIGLSMLVGLILSLYMFFKSFKWRYFFSSLLIMTGLIGLSTRTGIMGAIGIFSFLMLAIVFYGKRAVNIGYLAKGFIVSVFSIFLVVVTIKVIELVKEYEYIFTKFQSLAYEHPRQHLFNAGMDRIDSRSWLFDVFGESSTNFKLEVGSRIVNEYNDGLLVEVDYVDLIGIYGWIMTILILAFPLYMFLKILFLFLTERSFRDLIFLLCMTVFLTHSFLAGHGIISPLVATIMVVVYTYIFHTRRVNI